MTLSLRKWISIVLISIILIFLFFGLIFYHFSRDLPPLELVHLYKPARVTHVYDRENNVVYEFFIEKREPTKLDSISPKIQRAFITLEDKRFYSHFGIDPIRLIKAFFVNIREGEYVQGASTITQQLARNMFLTFEKTIDRKIKEIILALILERNFTKDEILEKYLNQIYFGDGIYGVKAACKYLFNKSPSDVTWAEAALLASIPKNANLYSPFKNPELAKKRRDFVLEVLYKNGVIDKKTYQNSIAEPLPEKKSKENKRSRQIGRYYFEEVRKYINSLYGEDFLYKEGVNVKLAMDIRLQEVAEKVIDSILSNFDNRVRAYHKKRYKKADSLRLEAALIAVDVETGDVLALVGGRDFLRSQFNRATQAKRQVGSSFKPFIYLAAIHSGIFPGDPIVDLPYVVENDGSGKPWKPRNFDDQFLGFITVRDGLALSRNLATVHILEKIGPGSVIEFAHKLGIKENIPPFLSIALGSTSLSLWEMCEAYLTIANLGKRKKMHLIKEIRLGEEFIVEKAEYKEEKVFDEKEVYILIDMMKSTFNYGTAIYAKDYGFRAIAAGKTGTTDNYTDSWFIGFTPKVLCGVWVGFDTVMTLFDKATGAVLALPIWASFMKKANEIYNLPDTLDFTKPDGITYKTICVETGKLATKFCPKKRNEVYIEGKEPKNECEKHLYRTPFLKEKI
ncbi:MAG: PBP1A family penicillin-binding protein [Candidatus Hydrothermales bacterium]